MNTQELIEKFEEKLKDVQLKFGENFKTKVYEELLEDLKQLDELKKVKVPQGIANYIEYTKTNEWGMLEALDNVAYEDDKELRKWFNNNEENFVLAWIFGYEVDKEKLYTVKMKGVSGYCRYLNKSLSDNEYFLASENENFEFRTKHTKKELVDDGFGEVFTSPLFEVEEVEE